MATTSFLPLTLGSSVLGRTLEPGGDAPERIQVHGECWQLVTDPKTIQAVQDAATAQAAAEAAQGTATQAGRDAIAAQAAADEAAAAAETAQSTASTANEAALAAAGLADGKGEVIVQASAPTGSRAATKNLWIRLSDSQVHRYYTTTAKWVAVTDPAAIAAGQAAAAAQTAAGNAATAAAAAMAEARYAPRIMNRAPALADGKDKPVGAGWNQYNDQGLLVQMWRWGGTAWTRLDMSPTMIPVLQIGTGTAGDLTADRVSVTGEFAARLANILKLNVGNLVVTEGAVVNDLVAEKIAAAVARVIELDADRITSGQIDTTRLNAATIAAAVATVIQLNASRITTGTLDTARLNATTVAAAVANVIQLNASRITAGTISTARLDTQAIAAAVATIIELNASRITTGTLSSDRIAANSIAVGKILVNEELAAKIVQAMSVATKNLVVTDEAILNRATVINGLAADVVSAATIYASQLVVAALDGNGNLKADSVGTVQIVDGAVRAAQIHAEEVAGAVARFLTIEVGQLVAGTADIDSLVAQKIAGATADFQEAFIQNLRSNGAVIDEAVIADLAANIITSGLFRTAASGQRLEIDSNGLIMYGVDPDGIEYEMVRLGPSGLNLLTIGNTTVAADGVSTPSLDTDILTVGGEDIAALLAPLPRGVVGFAYEGSNSAWDGTGTEIIRLQAEAVLLPNRRYSITVDQHYVASRTASASSYVEQIRWSNNGTDVTASHAVIASARHFLASTTTPETVPAITGWIDTHEDNDGFGTSPRTCKFAISTRSAGGTDMRIIGREDYPLRITIRDEGPTLQATGRSWFHVGTPSGGSSDAPAPKPEVKRYTKTYTSTGFRTYNDDGSQASTPDVVQGLYAGGPSRFRRRGGWLFPSMTSDLSGATIEKIEVYFWCDHTHSSAGATVNPSVWGGTMATSLSPFTSVYGWKAGSGKWFTLPSSYHNGFRSGTHAGIGVVSTSTSSTQYARFRPTGAQIKITYRK